MLQVARGLEYIHAEGIVHGDLSAVSVLVSYLLICAYLHLSGECPPRF